MTHYIKVQLRLLALRYALSYRVISYLIVSLRCSLSVVDASATERRHAEIPFSAAASYHRVRHSLDASVVVVIMLLLLRT